MRADAWDARNGTRPEHECEPHPADYAPRGPGSMRIRSDIDPFTQANRVARHAEVHATQRIIYMDRRPHPSESAPHTWQGFSTGEWEGDMLKVSTII